MKDKIALKLHETKERINWGIKKEVGKLYGVKVEPRVVPNPLLKWPRNYKCVCGSNKKFKKCHLNELSRFVTVKDAKKINEKLEEYRAK